MPEILFLPFEKTVQTDGSKTLLQLARDAHIPLMSTCGGKKKCGKCAVLIEKIENTLPPASPTERAVLGDRVAKGYRLACEIRLDGEATVAVPAESRITDPVILTDAAAHLVPCRVRPDLYQLHVVVPPPEQDPVVADRERLLFALEKAHKVARPSMDPFVLRRLPHALRSDPKGIAVILRHKKEIIGFASGKGESLLGVAFDVGTTTVVAYLMDLTNGKILSVKASVNPQTAFGADVITRISFCREDPEGLERLRSGILSCLNDLVSAAATEIAVEPNQILSAVIVEIPPCIICWWGLIPVISPWPPMRRFFRNPRI
jgi:uncharacterized 2Fe-2S/4Fe-4S cluster protein (DUF4445 family)